MSELTDTRPSGPMKQEIVEEVGHPTLLLPSLVNRGLEANDRAKYLLSLLQAARAHADAPSRPCSSLRDERIAARVPKPELDRVVERSERMGPGLYVIPHSQHIHLDLEAAIAEMVAPFTAVSDGTGPDVARLDAMLTGMPDLSGDRITGSYIDRITSARRDQGDSLHLLVMDAHRALNRLQAQIATASIDGAAAYGLTADDPELVAAFMAGLNETAPLKFDHPGLATSATNAGGRLLIQNDLGTTEAHVVVLAVDNLKATLTYSDVHQRRLRFFESMLEPFGVLWSDAERHSAGTSLGEYHLTVGRYEAPDRAALKTFLRHVGSRLVFLLDWNRARKRLSTFLATDDAIEVLSWAAENRVGHMAFLALGGERLIYDAVELSAKVPARYGEPLVNVLGRDATLAITRFALRSAAEGMLAGKSPFLIRDELRVEVLRHEQVSHRHLLDASAEHAGLIVECAQLLQSALVRLGTETGDQFLRRAIHRAAGWEHRADEILVSQRQAGHRVEGGEALTALTAVADDAIDALEEAAFLLGLLPSTAVGVVRPILEPVAAIVVMTAREHLKAVEIAREVVNGSAPDDLEDFLVAVDRVATLEHDADAADRMARAALVTGAPEFRTLYVADSVSRSAEDATDALLRSVLGLRDHILGALSVR